MIFSLVFEEAVGGSVRLKVVRVYAGTTKNAAQMGAVLESNRMGIARQYFDGTLLPNASAQVINRIGIRHIANRYAG